MNTLDTRLTTNHNKVIERIVRKRGKDQILVYKGQIMFFEFLNKLYISLETPIILVRIMKLNESSMSIFLLA
jgi:hypothetical protein